MASAPPLGTEGPSQHTHQRHPVNSPLLRPVPESKRQKQTSSDFLLEDSRADKDLLVISILKEAELHALGEQRKNLDCMGGKAVRSTGDPSSASTASVTAPVASAVATPQLGSH